MNKASVIAEWEKILLVDYWRIFDVARRILAVIPVADRKISIEHLAETADRLLENRLMPSHDPTGAVFQRMIVDRKFLAAYDTAPASAALLIGLALVPDLTPAMKPWGDAENVTSARQQWRIYPFWISLLERRRRLQRRLRYSARHVRRLYCHCTKSTKTPSVRN